MNVRLEVLGRISLLHAEGRLDFGSAAGFQHDIEAAFAAGGTVPAAMIVDCTALEYVSSAGLRVLLQAARGAQRAGIWFALCALRPAVREVFELSGFNRLMGVHADRATALAHAPPGPG